MTPLIEMSLGLRVSRRLVSPFSTEFSRRIPIRNARTISSRAAFEPPRVDTTSIDISQFPSVPRQEEPEEPEFWRRLPSSSPFKDVTRDDFLSWRWNTKNIVETKEKLYEFIDAVVPEEIPRARGTPGMQTRAEFESDVAGGIRLSTMSVRLMPYILSRINWTDPANCPIFRQFVPLKSVMIKDHPQLGLDSLHEKRDSPVEGIVHRYPDKALFLPVGVCPVYCGFCTRSYGVGPDTHLVSKEPFKPSRTRLEKAFAYIESQENLRDIVVSGGDAFYLPHHVLEEIGDRLINMKNIKRFRFATKGLAVAPSRFLDKSDPWPDALIRVADKATKAGKHFALHTHFNHPNEISWITEKATRRLVQANVMVRNQSVLLRGVNDDVSTMSALIEKLAEMMIYPYYVYQCDSELNAELLPYSPAKLQSLAGMEVVTRVEHFRTPLQTILDMESQLRGSIAGFMMPNFVVDLPGGGGKRLACSFESYDRNTGVSTFRAPILTNRGKEGKIYKYYDPLKPSS
ncbi:L-lysine-aminomutase [Nemania sp. FL0031]|nr:L-lysine-aminomutase [Nemania sp. FL0031]